MEEVPKNKGGRPRKNLDPEIVKRLAAHFCSVDEIAAIMGCCPRLVQLQCGHVVGQENAKIKMSLKRKLISRALDDKKPDTACLIFACKCIANLSERVKVENGDQPFTIKVLRGVSMDDI